MDYVALACLVWTCFALFCGEKSTAKTADDFLPRRYRFGQHHHPDAALGISYETYQKYTSRHRFPAHAGNGRLRHPDYENREVIRRQLPILSIAIMVGMFVGVVSAVSDGQYVPL